MYEKYKEYALDVINGNVKACTYITLSAKRYLNRFNDDRYIFKTEECDKVENFIGKLKHYIGKHKGKPFNLLPFQKFITYNIYGWYFKDRPNERVTKNVYYSVSRKNAKTSLFMCFLLYNMLEQGTEHFVVANSAKQSQIAFDIAVNYLRTIDPQEKLFLKFRDNIRCKVLNSRLWALSSDSSKQDGFRIQSGLLDEYHAASSNNSLNILQSGMSSTDNPLLFITTTRGFNKGVCYEYELNCIDVLKDNKEDETIQVFIYTQDEEDDIEDSSLWIKSNPSIGEIVKEEFLKQQIIQTKNNPSLLTSFKTKNLNIWCDTSTQWLSTEVMDKCIEKFELDRFKDKDNYVLGLGIDLGSTSDLTCISYVIKDIETDKCYFHTEYYLPITCLEDNNPNHQFYRNMKQQGYLKTTPTNYTDYDYILHDIIKVNNEILPIETIHFDSYNATQFTISMIEHNLPCKPFSQSLWNFNLYTKEFERRLLQENIVIQKNPITEWCFRNCELKRDHNDNCKPVKGGNKYGKIDGVISMLQGFAVHFKPQENTFIIPL